MFYPAYSVILLLNNRGQLFCVCAWMCVCVSTFFGEDETDEIQANFQKLFFRQLRQKCSFVHLTKTTWYYKLLNISSQQWRKLKK